MANEKHGKTHLVVGALALLAFSALEEIRFRSLNGGELRAVDSFLRELCAHVLHLIRRHFLQTRFNDTHQSGVINLKMKSFINVCP